jgi:hypothetical protein
VAKLFDIDSISIVLIYLVKILQFELILNSSWVHGNYIYIKYL